MSKATVVAAAQAGLVAAIDATTAARLTLDEANALPSDIPAPTISNATVVPATLPFGGGTVTVSADVQNADTVTLNGAVVTLPTPFTVTLDTDLTLAATGPGGSAPPVTLSVDVADAPPAPLPTVTIKTVGTDRVLLAPGFCEPGRYDRFQTVRTASGDTAALVVKSCNFNSGGSSIPLGFALQLALTFDGVAVATAMTVPTSNSVTFSVPLAGKRGWYRTGVTGAPAGWSVYDYAIFIDDGSGVQPTHMPVVIGSYGLLHPYKASSTESPTPRHMSAMVPAVYSPVTQPIALRECPEFATEPRRDQLVQTQLAICRQDDKYRTVTKGGTLLNTANRQDYFYSDMSEPRPRFQMLDGPRGRGTVVCPTHMEVGGATPPGMGFVGNVYFCEPRRFGKIRASGEVVTLAGERHRAPPSYWDDAVQNVDLVGDWSQMPANRPHYFKKLWGMTWNSFTFRTDTTAPPNPAERNLQPHITGVEAFLADSLNDRVAKLKFDKDSHLVPPIVTEFFLGRECWDVVELGFESQLLAISVRQENRIVVVDMAGVVVEQFGATLPEGLYYLPDSTTPRDGWLYYGSKATKSVRKRHMTTGQDLLAANLTTAIDTNSMYVKIAVSDGTFGPRGMIGVVTWSNNRYGYPALYRANGSEIDGWLWAGTARPGRQWVGSADPPPGYTSAIGFGFGRMVFGTVHEGAIQLSKALPTDAPMSAMYFTGQREWYDRGYQLTHGHRGFGQYGLPQPWGVSNPIDAFLIGNGHVPG